MRHCVRVHSTAAASTRINFTVGHRGWGIYEGGNICDTLGGGLRPIWPI